MTGIDGYDWGSVGWSNPVPGDPDVVRQIGGQISDLASESSLQNQLLQSVGDAASTIWSGPAANTFHPTMKKLPGQLDQLTNSYNDAAYAINGFWPKHQAAQQLAVQALNKAQAAQAAISTAQAQVSSSQSSSQAAAGAYNQAVNPPAGTPPPATAAAKAANLTRTSNLAMAYRSAQTQLGNAQSALNSARSDMSAAVSMRNQATSDFSGAAGVFVGLIKQASKAGIQNVHHGFFSSLGSAISGGIDSAFHAGEHFYHEAVHLTDEGLDKLGTLAVDFGRDQIDEVEAGWHDFSHAMASALPVLKVIDTVLSDASLVVGIVALVVAPIPGLDAVLDPALEGLNEVLMVAKTGDDLLELAGGDKDAKEELIGDAIGMATMGLAGGLEADGAEDAEKAGTDAEETAAEGSSGATPKGGDPAAEPADTAPATTGEGAATTGEGATTTAGATGPSASADEAGATGATSSGSGATDEDDAAGAPSGSAGGSDATDEASAGAPGGSATTDEGDTAGDGAGSAESPSAGAAESTSASEPSGSEPSGSEPSASEPSGSEPAAAEPPASEPPASEPPASEPSASEPAAAEPPASEPPASEPSASEPSASEPSASEPSASEPSASEPAGPEPSSDPSASQPSGSEPPASEPQPAEASTSHAPSSESPASEPGPSQPQPSTDPSASSESPAASNGPAGDTASAGGHEPATTDASAHEPSSAPGHESSPEPSSRGNEPTSEHGSSEGHSSPEPKQTTLSKVLGKEKLKKMVDFKGMRREVGAARSDLEKVELKDLPKTYVKWAKQAYHEQAGETVGHDGKVVETAKDGLAPLRKILYVRDHVETANDVINFADKTANGHGNFLQRQQNGKDWETQAWDKATGSDDEPPIWVTMRLDEIGVG